MEQIIKRVIWIDKEINSTENKAFLEILQSGIKNSKFYPVESVEEAFKLIKNQREKVALDNNTEKVVKVFQFRLFYVIVSGSLSNDFFNEYVKATKELTIISANIIFCADKDKHMRSAYYLDDFLNPGKVYNEKTIVKIIEYINKDECPFLNESSIMESKKEYIPQKRNYGNVFFNANNISDITYPFFFGQLINSTFVNDYDLEGFQKFLLDYYPEVKHLIFPSREKKITIPYYLLAKFYLHMYTYECNFFKYMNLDLSNDKFDLYRVYIFLLYNALNQKSIKPYYTNSLYRGTVLSKKELDTINNLINEKNGNNNKDGNINICLYFSKMFLSFSKNIDVAKGFMNKGNEQLIPVLFEVLPIKEEDLKNNDFFVSNLDLDNITEFDEEEVLFLPFSCFEIVSVIDDTINVFGEKIHIKKITLNYLNKYKKSLYQYIESIKEKEKFEVFLKQVINSEFSNEISNLINFDIGNEFKTFIKKKFQLKNNIFNFNLQQCLKKNNTYAQTAFNNLFPEEPEFMQKVMVDGCYALLVVLKNGLNIILRPSQNKVLYSSYNNLDNKNVVMCGEPIELKHCCTGDIGYKMLKANKECMNGDNKNCVDKCIDKLNHKEKKMNINAHNYFELYTVGIAIGDFIANYDDIKDKPLMVKLQSLGNLLFSCLVPFLPKIVSKYLPQAICTKIPIVMASISALELVISIKDIALDKSLTKSQTASLIMKKISLTLGQIALTYAVGKIGFKILLFLNVSPGIIIGVAAIGLGIALGYGIAKIKKKYFNEKEETENLSFFSDSTYYQYIPKKFREYCIPTLSWNGVSKNAKSFAIELVEDGYRKWLIINIKKWIRKIHNENYLDVGDNIVEYKGISKHPYKVTFILYEMNKEKCTPEEWGVGENTKKDYSEELSKYYNQVAVLDVF